MARALPRDRGPSTRSSFHFLHYSQRLSAKIIKLRSHHLVQDCTTSSASNKLGVVVAMLIGPNIASPSSRPTTLGSWPAAVQNCDSTEGNNAKVCASCAVSGGFWSQSDANAAVQHIQLPHGDRGNHQLAASSTLHASRTCQVAVFSGCRAMNCDDLVLMRVPLSRLLPNNKEGSLMSCQAGWRYLGLSSRSCA